MAEERVQRRLAAILVADVVGYSQMMGEDEVGTLTRLKLLRSELFDPTTEKNGGRVFKSIGDGVLVEFSSAVDAVRNAIEVQLGLANQDHERPIRLRIGINVGDVIVDDEDVFGDGVNVAARLEGLADPGGICLSGTAYDQVRGKLDLNIVDRGEQSLKNISEPVRVLDVVLDGKSPGNQTAAAFYTKFDRPAIAVLPFSNMSGDVDQDYFADGLSEDIITTLSLFRSFPVIARNSTFAYKGTSPDIRTVGVELGARYVVEGSVRRSANRVRVTAQLINAETGHHIWADRYDRELEDIFEVQDELTQRIASIIDPMLERSERSRAETKPPSSLSAWEYCLRGYAYIYKESHDTNNLARDMFTKAIDLDPNYARAYAGLAYSYAKDFRFIPKEQREEWLEQLGRFSRRAVELDELDSDARAVFARSYILGGDFESAITEVRKAVELNPYNALSNNVLGNMLTCSGRYEEGIPWIERAVELNPLDPQSHLYFTHLALGHLGAKRFDKAVELARESIRRHPNLIEPHILLASALGYLEQVDEAAVAIEPFRDRVRKYTQDLPYWAVETKAMILSGLDKAGL